MSSSNCCFPTCIQISQEAGQVVWYSHLFQNFPQFTVVHTVKGFGIVNKAEINVFLELSCFSDDPADVGNLISGSSAFSKTSLNIRKWRGTKKPLDESERGDWKSWIKAQHSENEDHGIWSHHFMGNRWGNSGNKCQTLYFWAPKSLQMVTTAMKLKDAYSLEGKLWPT